MQRLVVLVDGHCSLCKGWTRWSIRRDAQDMLRFASQQGEAGKQVLGRLDRDPDESVLVIRDDSVYDKSRAVLEILRVLSWPWPVAYAGILIPWFLRDFVYDIVARNRYDWFGREEENFCETPPNDLQRKLLD